MKLQAGIVKFVAQSGIGNSLFFDLNIDYLLS